MTIKILFSVAGYPTMKQDEEEGPGVRRVREKVKVKMKSKVSRPEVWLLPKLWGPMDDKEVL